MSSIEAATRRLPPSGPDWACSFGEAGRGGVVGPGEWGAEAGEGLPASAATRSPPGLLDEGTSVPVRGGEGSGESRRGGTDAVEAVAVEGEAERESSRMTCLIEAC